MKSKAFFPILLIGLGFFFGFMIGLTMDPLDRAIRKAQKINKADLSGVSSLRSSNSLKFLDLFKKPQSISELLQTDPKKREKYIASLKNNISKKEKAIETLDHIKEFITLAKKEVFIDNSLQRYLYTLGQIQLQHGMVYQAISNLQRSYDINPNDFSTAQLLASSYLGLYQVLPDGSDKESAGGNAVRFFKLSLKSSPDHINSLYGLALIYTDQGQYDTALPLFSQILQKDPENIDALLGAARIYYEKKNFDQTRKIYEQAEALLLESKNKQGFLKKQITIGNADKKLETIRKNIDILYKEQSPF